MDTLGKRLHVNFMGYVYWFMSISIYHIKDNSISVDQDRYATSVVDKYMDNYTVKTIIEFYKTTFPSDMIFNKYDASTSDDQVDNLTREFNIFYITCIVLLICLLSTRL